MVTIENSYECFVELWRQLERTRQLMGMQYRRFCIRRVMKAWLGEAATDEMVWEVCRLATMDEERPVGGLDELPPPGIRPRKSREFLRALVAVREGIGIRKVDLRALDRAYSAVFPQSRPIDLNKKGRPGIRN